MSEEIDTGWYAISDLELRQFHMAALLAGGGEYVLPAIERIRSRTIEFETTETGMEGF